VNDRRFKEPDVVCQFAKCIFFGHTPTSYLCGADRILTYKRKDARGDRIADYYKIHLDTGASLRGVLGCFCVDTCSAYYVSKNDTVCGLNCDEDTSDGGLGAYAGCLVGGAAGDALGYAVEFLEDASIFRRYGEQGITRYDLLEGVAQISDDTQMTLFTAEGLLNAEEDREAVVAIHGAYLDWLETQNSKTPVSDEGLLAIPTLYSRRAPGNTCLAALESGICGTIEDPINHSKGCGGVMRVAPIALYYHGVLPQREIDLLAARAAAITHGHPLGYIPAAMLVHMICRVLDGATLGEAVRAAMQRVPALFPEAAAHAEVQLALLEEAVSLAEGEYDDLDAIRSLGEGWVAEETLAIAVYCALKHQGDFEKCLIAAVNHSGDSDSTGAVAGNLLGAVVGLDGIPRHLRERLELSDSLLELAERLWEANGARK
jgi:ADP-ribosylglycohydrolase